MQIIGTKEAFAKLISKPGVHELLGVKPGTVRSWKTYLKEGTSISIDKMEEMLQKGGAIVKQEKIWILA